MKPNKYIIFAARKFWFWFWKMLMDGFAPSDKNGNYRRPTGFSYNGIPEININENKNLYLLIGSTCPWCHRLIIAYTLLNLSNKIKIIFLKPNYKTGEWILKKDFYNCKNLKEVYSQCNQANIFRATVPVFINYKDREMKIISNESRDILSIFNSSIFNSSSECTLIKGCDKKLLDLINNDINDGVYKCGFARNQNAYIQASQKLFSALTTIEKILEVNGGPWLLGSAISVADVYLFPTIIRWEYIYSKLFKCTEKDIYYFKNIILWRYKFFNLKGISKTCSYKNWLQDYYQAIFPLNPNQIIPLQPSLEELINLKKF
tara:strand:- start:55 stop:1008 length:954 start_codon:yes stop_codon:yes gene_type:complete